MTAATANASLWLGHSPDWWDMAMLLSVIFAAIAAVAVGFSTVGSVRSNKRAAAAADRELRHFQSETARRIADATTAGIEAGERAGRAQTDVDKARVEIAKANAEAARLEKEAAEANLETERVKSAVAWRTLSQDAANRLIKSLLPRPAGINIYYTDGDPEALYYAAQFSRAFILGGWSVGGGATKFANALVFGIAVPTGTSPQAPEPQQALVVQEALRDAGIPFNTSHLPAMGLGFNMSQK